MQDNACHSSGSDESFQLIRQWDNQTNQPANLNSTHAYITVPITLPGSKPGEANQTVHIQMLNPNPITCSANPKLQIGQFQIPIQDYTEGTTVLTVAFNPNDGGIYQSHGLSEGMCILLLGKLRDPVLKMIYILTGVTLLTALQPNDLQSLPQPHLKGMEIPSERPSLYVIKCIFVRHSNFRSNFF